MQNFDLNVITSALLGLLSNLDETRKRILQVHPHQEKDGGGAHDTWRNATAGLAWTGLEQDKTIQD